MILRYKARALRHIESIHRRVAANDPAAAKRVILRIQHSVSRLERHPFSGRSGVVAGTRIVVVPGLPYVAVYRVREQFVDILAVLHTARRRRS
jgi:addiction module RelE/StbE family toxin